MLPADSLKFLTELAAKANPGARIVTAAQEPDHVYYVEQPDGRLEKVKADAPPDAHAPGDLDTLVRLALASQLNETAAEIWYTRAAVTVVNPDFDPRWRATLELSPSPQLAKLAEWDKAGRTSLSQAAFVIALRTLFAGCAPESLLPAVRGVNATKNSEVSQQISQGKVSLSKAVVAQMTGTAAIPEEVILTVPVFAEAAVLVKGNVRVVIDPDPQSEQFGLVVRPGDIEQVQAQAEETLRDRLKGLLGETPIPLYRGTP